MWIEAINILFIILIVSIYAFFDNIDIVNILDYESDLFFEVLDPKELMYTYRIRPATNFGIILNDSIEPFKTKLVPSNPPQACEVPRNTYYMAGNIALVERGLCTFKQKAINAEKAGAKGIIISDHDKYSDLYIDMLDDDSAEKTSIPAAFLLGQDGFIIRTTLKKLNLEYAEINIPLNMTKIGIQNSRRQPPWTIW